MGLTVYISNKEIQAVLGTGNANGVRANGFYSYETPEGSYLNGTVTDVQLLTDAIKDFWEKEKLPKKNVHLIINSSQIIGRVTNCPMLNRKKMLTLLEHEFTESDRQENPIVGYTELGNDKAAKTSRIFAEMSTYDYIMTFVQIFAEAGVSLSGISSAVGKMVDLVEDTNILAPEISIIMMIDDVMLTTIFFLNGKYYYSSATRVFAHRGTMEFGIEIAGVVSRLNQFARSENIEGHIQSIMLSRFEPEEVEIVQQAIPGLHIGDISCTELVAPAKVKVSGGDSIFREMAFPIAGLLSPKNHADILDRAIMVSPKSQQNAKNTKLALPYLVVSLVMLAITIGLFVVNYNKGTYLSELNAHNTDVTILTNASEYDKEVVTVKELTQQKKSLELLTSDVQSYPALKSEVRNLIERTAINLAEVKFTGYDAESGILSIQATAADVESTSTFIDLLNKEDIFEYVNYTGYTYNQTTEDWTINMVCSLSENAGK
ncbi:MAG: hypothetical protein K6B41_06230 [Butyrivibrio sp.]|nr:hypothetical protein [Butyrivibrio sp.]